MRLAKKKEKASTPGQMDLLMMVTGLTTRLMVSAPTFGKMVESVMASGSTTTCPDTEFSSIRMECVTRVNSYSIKKKDLVFTNGPMEESMRAGGIKASSTESAPTSIQ
jgi:hypothetical protein